MELVEIFKRVKYSNIRSPVERNVYKVIRGSCAENFGYLVLYNFHLLRKEKRV